MKFERVKYLFFFAALFTCICEQLYSTVSFVSTPRHVFSKTVCKFFSDSDYTNLGSEIVWEKSDLMPFNELIVSWNSLRPSKGYVTIWVSVKYRNAWTRWHRLALWGFDTQKTFINKLHTHVHTKHCRIEMQKKSLARGFRIKAVFHDGAHKKNLKAFFGCISRLSRFEIIEPDKSLPSVAIHNVPRQSQMVLKHERSRDLCSPTSTSMIVEYFRKNALGLKPQRSLHDFSVNFASLVHDQGYLDIYGNWILNVAQAFDAAYGKIFFHVERLNSFYDLHHYLSKKIPIAVSVRSLPGGATPYANGHFMVVVGWNRKKQRVLCIDPAFNRSGKTLRAYKILDFLRAWGRSSNLSYIPTVR